MTHRKRTEKIPNAISSLEPGKTKLLKQINPIRKTIIHPYFMRLGKPMENDISSLASFYSSMYVDHYFRMNDKAMIFFLFQTLCRFTQPFILARFIRYFAPCSNMSLTDAIILATLTSLFPWIMFLFRHMSFARSFLAGMHLRCAYSGLIFRKVGDKEVQSSFFFVLDYEIIHWIIGKTFQWKDYQFVD